MEKNKQSEETKRPYNLWIVFRNLVEDTVIKVSKRKKIYENIEGKIKTK